MCSPMHLCAGGLPRGIERHELADLVEREVERFCTANETDDTNAVRAVDAVSRPRAGNRRNEAHFLVIAQGIRADAGFSGYVTDGEFSICSFSCHVRTIGRG